MQISMGTGSSHEFGADSGEGPVKTLIRNKKLYQASGEHPKTLPASASSFFMLA